MTIPKSDKLWIVIGIGVAGLLLLVVGLLIYFRKNRSVAWATNFMVLLVTTGALALVPVVSRRSEQVLLLKIGAVVFLSLLPSWLYLQFIAVKGKALRDEYVLNLLRIHPGDRGIQREK